MHWLSEVGEDEIFRPVLGSGPEYQISRAVENIVMTEMLRAGRDGVVMYYTSRQFALKVLHITTERSMEQFDGNIQWNNLMETFNGKIQWKHSMEQFDRTVHWNHLLANFLESTCFSNFWRTICFKKLESIFLL